MSNPKKKGKYWNNSAKNQTVGKYAKSLQHQMMLSAHVTEIMKLIFMQTLLNLIFPIHWN
jgi:hypothetical protein